MNNPTSTPKRLYELRRRLGNRATYELCVVLNELHERIDKLEPEPDAKAPLRWRPGPPTTRGWWWTRSPTHTATVIWFDPKTHNWVWVEWIESAGPIPEPLEGGE